MRGRRALATLQQTTQVRQVPVEGATTTTTTGGGGGLQDTKQIIQRAAAATEARHDWTKREIAAIYYQPLMELTYQSVSTPRTSGDEDAHGRADSKSYVLIPETKRPVSIVGSTSPARYSSAPS